MSERSLVEPQLSLEERVLRLEGKLGWRSRALQLSSGRWWAAVGLAALGIVLGLQGIGLPNHYYQVLLAILTIVIAYQREWLVPLRRFTDAVLAASNVLMLAILFKLVIGSGKRFPLHWLHYPVIKTQPGEGRLPELVPQFELQWHPTPLADVSLNLTVIQTFLLLLTIMGGAVEFQPFASLTALLLVLFSIPAFVSFEWSWVFPAMVVIFAAFYVQSASFDD